MTGERTVETVAIIVEAVGIFAGLLAQAFERGDKRQLERLSSVLTEPCKSRLALRHAEETARRIIEEKRP